MLERDSLKALAVLEQRFASMPEFKATPLPPKGRDVLLEAARRLQDNYPCPHPLCAGPKQPSKSPLKQSGDVSPNRAVRARAWQVPRPSESASRCH